MCEYSEEEACRVSGSEWREKSEWVSEGGTCHNVMDLLHMAKHPGTIHYIPYIEKFHGTNFLRTLCIEAIIVTTRSLRVQYMTMYSSQKSNGDRIDSTN